MEKGPDYPFSKKTMTKGLKRDDGRVERMAMLPRVQNNRQQDHVTTACRRLPYVGCSASETEISLN